jgi:hypothetical protein
MEEKKQNSNQIENMNALAMFFESDKFATAQRVCFMLASSDLVPKEYQYRPINYTLPDGRVDQTAKAQDEAAKNKAMANCLIALNKAALLKTDPMTIMQNMSPVHGKPSWSASFMIGSINASSRFTPLRFKFGEDGRVKETFTVYKKNGGGEQKNIDMPNYTCVAFATDKETKEVLEGAETISIRMAFDEGWLTKDGSKWLTMPRQMLMYRAAAFWQREYCPEILQGLMTTDEAEDVGYSEYEEIKGEAQKAIDENANSGEQIGFTSVPAQEAEATAPQQEPAQPVGMAQQPPVEAQRPKATVQAKPQPKQINVPFAL